MPNDQKVKAQRVLELNINHSMFASLQALLKEDKEKLKKYTNVLYNCALLMEGMPIEDPVAFSNDTCDLIS